MVAALSPDLAVAYVRELSADVRAVIVLDGEGEVVAGEPALREPAGALLGVLVPGPWDLALRVQEGVVWVARDPGHSLVAAAGPLALTGPTLCDVRCALSAFTASPPDFAQQSQIAPEPGSELQRATKAVLSACLASNRGDVF